MSLRNGLTPGSREVQVLYVLPFQAAATRGEKAYGELRL